MSLTRQVAHNTIIQMVGKVLSTLLGVVALGMMTRYLGVEKFGWYTTTITFLQFIGILTDFGLIPVTAQMMGEENKIDKKKLLQNLMGFRITTSVFFFGLAPFVALLFPYNKDIHIAIGISAISFVGIAINQVLTGYFQYRLKMYIQALGELLSRVALIAGLALAITYQLSFLSIMGILVFSNVLYTLFLLIGATKNTSIKPAYDWKIWKTIIIKMWPIAISILFNVVYLKGDLLLLTLYRSQDEVGLYGSAYRVVEILSQMAMLFMGLLLPLLAASWSSGKAEEFQKRAQKSFDGVILFALPVVFGTFLLAPSLMQLIAGEEFTLAGIPLKVLTLAVFGVFVGSFFGHLAVAINQQKKTIWVYVSSAILTLLGYLVFIPKYGMIGAAWMSVFSEVYVGFLLGIIIYPLAKIKLNFSTAVKGFLSALVMAVFIIVLRDLPVALLVLGGAAIYGTMLLLTGAVSKEMVKEIVQLKK